MDREILPSLFLCPCTKCGKTLRPLPELVDAVQAIQRRVDWAITITSGCRCITHNTEVGGAKASRHLTGEACDILIGSSARAYDLLSAAMDQKNIKFYELCPEHLHIDVRAGAKRIIVGKG